MLSNRAKKVKLVIGITAYQSIALIPGQLKFLSSYFEVYLLAPNHESVVSFCIEENATLIPIKIERNPSPLKDMVTFFRLVKVFYKLKPDIVNLGTMKISFLGIIAARIIGIKNRVYTCRGFRFQDQTGFNRMYLILFERIISLLANQIISIRKTIADIGIEKGIFKPEKVIVFAKGSSNGINLDTFNDKNIDNSLIEQYKLQYKLDLKFVYGFVGRMVDPKGINELYNAFQRIHEGDNQSVLIMVGSFYENEVADKTIIEKFKNHPGIILCGKQKPELIPTFMSLFDLLVLPTWREGFGNVLIQAAAMGVPVLTNNIAGCKDAVKDKYNGVLITPKDQIELYNSMTMLKQDESIRRLYSENGKIWAQNFNSEIIWSAMLKFYNAII